ncbi:MAG: hypothetical protein J1E06_08560 [Acutalibacter sp.]|nr:hypothetical protein [Acutalibacter sp.]
MKRLIKCEFNIDTACVELRFSDGCRIDIDTVGVENEIADNMYQRGELDWLIYNKPLEYAQLVLGGDLEGYIQGTAEHRLID